MYVYCKVAAYEDFLYMQCAQGIRPKVNATLVLVAACQTVQLSASEFTLEAISRSQSWAASWRNCGQEICLARVNLIIEF